MKTRALILISIIITSFVALLPLDAVAVHIPPTRAYSNVIAGGVNISASNYRGQLNIVGNGVTIGGNNSTQTVTITAGGTAFNSSEIVQPTSEYTKYQQETVITNFQRNDTAWTNQSPNGCTMSSNTTSFIYGSQSLQGSTFGNGTSCIFRSPTFSTPINLSNQIVTTWIYVNDTTDISELRLTVTNDSYTHFLNYRLWGNSVSSLNWIMPNMWSRVTFSLTQTDTGGSGMPDLTKINSMQFRFTDTGTNPTRHKITILYGGISYYPNFDYPIASFTFDNDDITQYTQAMPRLDIWHYPATAFSVEDFVGIDSNHLNLQQLQSLYNQHGWDISPKTKTNPYLTSLSPSQLTQELHDSKYFLINNGMSSGTDVTAYNHGAFNATVIKYEQQYEKAGRTIAEGCPNVSCGGLSETYPPADWYRLRVLDVLNSTSLTSIENRINLAYANHDWLIFEFHQVEPQGTPLTTSEMVSADTFGNIVNYTHTKGFHVMTISNVMADFPYTLPGFKINTNSCSAGQFANAISNSTGLLTCATPSTGGSGVSLLNGFNGTINIVPQDGNTTVTNSSNTIKIGLGVNPLIAGGSYQDVTKGFKIDKLNDSSGIVSGSDTSKKITFLNSGMTTGVTTTIRNNATTSQGINIPATRETETLAMKPQLSTVSPSNGNGTTATAGRMQHIGETMKAQVTGRMFIIIYGDVTNTGGAGDGALMQIRYGSGTAPSNGAALTGTTCGTQIKFVSASASEQVPFMLECEVNGLTLGTSYWVDVGLNAVTGGTAKLGEVRADTWET